jgi:hypothetical protein
LGLFGTLHHLAANMNQIAHKRNRDDVLNALERAELQYDATMVQELVMEIKSYLR